MRTFGLLGYPLGHSFSKSYFELKFSQLKLTQHEFKLFEWEKISDFFSAIQQEKFLVGFSVTSPHKESVITLLDDIDPMAKEIGAVNCVKVNYTNGRMYLTGFNTDAYGFRQTIKPFLEPQHQRALVIGTGGAAKAVAFALKSIGVDVFFLTRDKSRFPDTGNYFDFNDVSNELVSHFKLIVNTSPAEMLLGSNLPPELPYEAIGPSHFCYDLIYQPYETSFLRNCKLQGAIIMNGLDMLYAQAEKAWEIWNTQ